MTSHFTDKTLNPYEYSEMLEKRILGGGFRTSKHQNGAIGQIDLAGWTSFTVSQTTLRNTLEKEAQLFEAKLSGSKLDFEDELILTRIDLIKKDILYGVKSSAYNGILIGRLRTFAEWLELTVLCNEGDKIIVYGENIHKVLFFCLSAIEIFKTKEEEGLSGFNYRCGIACVTEDSPLFIIRNEDDRYISSHGKILHEVENLESSAHTQSILCDECFFDTQKEFIEFQKIDENKYELKEIKNFTNIKIKKAVEKFLEHEYERSNDITIHNPVIQKKLIAFASIKVTGNKEVFIKNLIRDLRTNNISLLRLGIIRHGRINLICHTPQSHNQSKQILSNFQNMISSGYQLKVGITSEFLWVGNLVLEKGEDSVFDVMGQGINLACRMAIHSVKSNTHSEILCDHSFINSLNEDGYKLNLSEVQKIQIIAKGFSDTIPVFIITNTTVENSEVLEITNNDKHFPEKVIEISSGISDLFYTKTKNYYFSINAANFIVTKLLTFSSLRQNHDTPEELLLKQNDFLTLSKIALANIKNGKSIIDILENIVAKIPELGYPQKIISNLSHEEMTDLQNIAMITFGRHYDFRISTLRFCLNLSEEKIKNYMSKGFLTLDGKKGFGSLLPSVAYILDLQANEKERFDLHELITIYIWKSLKKYKHGSPDWYEKGRVVALHARYSNFRELSNELRNSLAEIFEYAVEKRAYLDILLFESNVLKDRNFKKKKELIYQLVIVHLKFLDIYKAKEILAKIIEIDSLSANNLINRKILFFYDLCCMKLNEPKWNNYKFFIDSQKTKEHLTIEEYGLAKEVLGFEEEKKISLSRIRE